MKSIGRKLWLRLGNFYDVIRAYSEWGGCGLLASLGRLTAWRRHGESGLGKTLVRKMRFAPVVDHLEARQMMSATVYVNDDWASYTSGAMIADADPTMAGDQGATFGTDAFGTITAGLSGVSSGGVVKVNAGSYSEAVNVNVAASVQLLGNVTIDSLAGTSSGSVEVQAATLTVGNSQNTTFSGVLAGTGGFTKIGTGTLTLAGASANTFTGTTTVGNGTLDLGKTSGVVSIAGPVTIGDGSGAAASAILKISANEQITDTAVLTLAGTDGQLSSNSGTTETITPLTTDFHGGDVKVSGTLVTTGDYVQSSGAGTTTLVTGGTLQIGSTGLGNFILASGKLQGAGTLQVTQFQNRTGGTIDPGMGTTNAGTLTILGNLYQGDPTLAVGSAREASAGIIHIDVGTTSGVNHFDRIAVGSNPNITVPAPSDSVGYYTSNGTVLFRGTLDIGRLSDQGTPTNLAEFDSVLSFSYRRLDEISIFHSRLPSDFTTKTTTPDAEGFRYEPRFLDDTNHLNGASVTSSTTGFLNEPSPASGLYNARKLTLTALNTLATVQTVSTTDGSAGSGKVFLSRGTNTTNTGLQHLRHVVTLVNNTGSAITGPVYLEVSNPVKTGTTTALPDVKLFNKAGSLLNANQEYSEYLVVSTGATAWAVGTSLSVQLDWFNPKVGLTMPSFTYTSQVLTSGFIGGTDAPPTVQWSTATATTSESGTSVTLTATLSAAATSAITVNYATANGSANAGSDYTSTSGTFTFAAGETSKSITVPINDDSLDEDDEAFTATLTNASGATVGSIGTTTVTIQDNDAPPTVSLSTSAFQVTEGAGPGTATVTLSTASGKTISVPYSTSDGTAVAGVDYTSASGTLTFNPGETSKTISLPILDNNRHQSNRAFTVTLGTPTNATTASPTSSTATIVDDDALPSFTGGSGVSINEDAGAQSITAWATNIFFGTNSGTAQSASFVIQSNSNPSLTGYVAISSQGNLSFSPAADAFGSATLTVVLQDADGDASTPVTFTITVASVNDAPSFTLGGSITVAEDATAQVVSSWYSATSPGPSNESSQTVTVHIGGVTNATLFSSGPTINANGALTFTPAPNANGSAVVSIYVQDDGGTARDGIDTSALQTLTITISSVNDAPSGHTDTYSKMAGPGSITGNVLDNDDDSHSNAPSENNIPLTANLVAGPSHALSFEFISTGDFTYTPALDYLGADSFTYQAIDSLGAASSTVTVHLGILAPAFRAFNTGVDENGLPLGLNATDPHYTMTGPTTEGTKTIESTTNYPLNGPWIPNDDKSGWILPQSQSQYDTDADSGNYTFRTIVNLFGTSVTTMALKGQWATDNEGVDILVNNVSTGITHSLGDPHNGYHQFGNFAIPGSYFVPGDNTVDFVVSNYSQANDNPVGLRVAGFVARSNQGPSAAADAFSTNEDSYHDFSKYDLLDNDSDPDFDPITITSLTSPAHGTVTIIDGHYRYTPAANYNGPDSFQYTITDGWGAYSTAIVEITVNPVADPPIANPDGIWILTGAPYSIPHEKLLANDDYESPPAIVIISQPDFGTLETTAGSSTYETDYPGDTGEDSFAYILSVGGLESIPAAVVVHVIDVAIWDGDAQDEDWSNPLNWDHDQLPNYYTHVIIPGDFTVNLAGTATVRDIAVTGTLLVTAQGALSVWDISEIDGTLRVDGEFEMLSGLTQITGEFLNAGHSTVEEGRLLILGTGSSAGTLEVSEAGEIFFGAPDYLVSGAVSTEGLVAMSNGRTTFTGSFISEATIISDATAIFQGVNILQRIGFQGGRLESTSSFNVLQDFVWAGGTLAGSGGLNIETGATLTIESQNDIAFLLEKNLYNYGTIEWAGDRDIHLGTNITITNHNKLLLSANAHMIGGTLVNSGEIRKLDSDLETVFTDMQIQSNRNITIDSGDIVLSDTTLTMGTFLIDVGAESSLVLRGLSHLVVGSSAMTGPGALVVDSPTAVVEISGEFTLTNLTLQQGTVFGDGSLAISNRLNWSGGTIASMTATANFSVDVLSSGLMAFSGPDVKRLTNVYLDNHGKSIWFGNSVIQVGTTQFGNPDNTTWTETASSSLVQTMGLSGSNGLLNDYFDGERQLDENYTNAMLIAQASYDAAVATAEDAYSEAIADAQQSSTSDTEDAAIADADEIAGPILDAAMQAAMESYLAIESAQSLTYQTGVGALIQSAQGQLEQQSTAYDAVINGASRFSMANASLEAFHWQQGMTVLPDVGLDGNDNVWRPTITYLVASLPNADARAALFVAYQKNYGTSLFTAVQDSPYLTNKTRIQAFLRTGIDDASSEVVTAGGFGTAIVSGLTAIRDWGVNVATELRQLTPGTVISAAASAARSTLAAATNVAGSVLNGGVRLIGGAARETGGFVRDVFVLLWHDRAALGSALSEGVRDGAHIVSNELTFGSIPDLNAEANRLVQENGGLYQVSQLSAAMGRELIVSAATAGAGGPVARLASRVAPNLLCRITSAQRILSPVSALRSLQETSLNISQASAALERGDMQAAARAFARGITSSFHLVQNAREANRMARAVSTMDQTAIASYLRACFAVGTPIQGEFGSRPIEQYRAGDRVWARAESDSTGPVELKSIEEVFVHDASLWHLHLGCEVIRTTDEHPFWVVGKGWTPTHALSIGDRLIGRDGHTATVEDVLDTGETETVYNFRVEEHHTYFVGGDDWGFDVWAHNVCVMTRPDRRDRNGNVIAAFKQQPVGNFDRFGTPQETKVDGVATSHAADIRSAAEKVMADAGAAAQPGSYVVYNRSWRTIFGGDGHAANFTSGAAANANLRPDAVVVIHLGGGQYRVVPIEIGSNGQTRDFLEAQIRMGQNSLPSSGLVGDIKFAPPLIEIIE